MASTLDDELMRPTSRTAWSSRTSRSGDHGCKTGKADDTMVAASGAALAGSNSADAVVSTSADMAAVAASAAADADAASASRITAVPAPVGDCFRFFFRGGGTDGDATSLDSPVVTGGLRFFDDDEDDDEDDDDDGGGGGDGSSGLPPRATGATGGAAVAGGVEVEAEVVLEAS
jgi:hypothetical protein